MYDVRLRCWREIAGDRFLGPFIYDGHILAKEIGPGFLVEKSDQSREQLYTMIVKITHRAHDTVNAYCLTQIIQRLPWVIIIYRISGTFRDMCRNVQHIYY